MGVAHGVPGRSARSAGGAARRAARARGALTTVLVGAAVVAALVATGLSGSDRWAAGAVAAACAVAAVVARPDPDPARWARGAAGEEATAVLLGRLPRSWAVLHDRRLPGRAGNIDHVVVGRRRVWVVDSKAYRGRLRAGWGGVRAGGHPVDLAPVAAQADGVAELLGVPVRAVVAIHGEGPPRRRRRSGVTVVPATALLGELRRADRWGLAPRRRRRRQRTLVATADRLIPAA